MSSPPLRLISNRATALGPGDSESLQNVCTEILPNGCACWVVDAELWYVLDFLAAPGGGNISPISGPGVWVPQTGGGGGGGIPMPDGTVAVPRGANFLNELSLGIFRPAAGKIGVASGNFLGLTAGNGLITNVDPTNPSVVRFVMQGFNRPLTGAENETAFAYVRIDPSAGDPQQAAFYVDITPNQLDTFGPAIKVIHAGHGDGIYVAQFADGSAYEAASFADGSRGYISTNQLPGQPNKTLFNALWDQPDVPNFGLYYADLSTANALTIRKRAATAVDGLTQIRIIDEAGPQRFGAYNDGSLASSSLAATGVIMVRDSPEHRLFGSEWNGVSADSVEALLKVVVSAPGTRNMRLYGITADGGTVLLWQTDLKTGNFDLQLHSVVNVATIQGLTNVDHFVDAQLCFELVNPTVADDTAAFLTVFQGGVPVVKRVTQGAPNSGGAGFRQLLVPN